MKVQTPKGKINPYFDLVYAYEDLLFPCMNQREKGIAKDRLLSIIPNYRNCYCEIGSGSGGYMLSLAEKSPHALFIGFELRFKRSVRTAQKALERGISNICVIRDKGQNLAYYIPREILSGIYINFPDPWDKKRWHKHRIICTNFLEEAALCLLPKGFIAIKTDHREYFEYMIETFQKSSLFVIKKISYDLRGEGEYNGGELSEFERLFIHKGVQINYLLVERV